MQAAGSRHIYSSSAEGTDLNEIRQSLQLLVDLSAQLPSGTLLSPRVSSVFRESCSSLENALTVPIQGEEHCRQQRSSPSFSGPLEAPVTSQCVGKSNPECLVVGEDSPQRDLELVNVLGDLTKVKESFRRRRVEQRLIHDQYQAECGSLSKRISELEDEVSSIRSEAFNATIELECMRGTVSGLDAWLKHWKSQYASEYSRDPTLNRPLNPRRKQLKYFEQLDRFEEQRDSLVDGLDAWMRGWNDSTDGFRAHAMN